MPSPFTPCFTPPNFTPGTWYFFDSTFAQSAAPPGLRRSSLQLKALFTPLFTLVLGGSLTRDLFKVLLQLDMEVLNCSSEHGFLIWLKPRTQAETPLSPSCWKGSTWILWIRGTCKKQLKFCSPIDTSLFEQVKFIQCNSKVLLYRTQVPSTGRLANWTVDSWGRQAGKAGWVGQPHQSIGLLA